VTLTGRAHNGANDEGEPFTIKLIGKKGHQKKGERKRISLRLHRREKRPSTTGRKSLCLGAEPLKRGQTKSAFLGGPWGQIRENIEKDFFTDRRVSTTSKFAKKPMPLNGRRDRFHFSEKRKGGVPSLRR